MAGDDGSDMVNRVLLPVVGDHLHDGAITTSAGPFWAANTILQWPGDSIAKIIFTMIQLHWQSRFRTTTDGGTGGLRYDTWQSPWLTSWQRPRSRQMSASGRFRRHRGRRLCRRSELVTLACGNAPGRADADQAQNRQEEEQSPHNHHHDGGRHLRLGGKTHSEGFNSVSVAAFEALASHRGRWIPTASPLIELEQGTVTGARKCNSAPGTRQLKLDNLEGNKLNCPPGIAGFDCTQGATTLESGLHW